MDKDCFNCGSTEDVAWREDKQEFFCDLCIETELDDLNKYHCVICGENGVIETEGGMLCNDCDCERLSCINNPNNPKTEEQFWAKEGDKNED